MNGDWRSDDTDTTAGTEVSVEGLLDPALLPIRSPEADAGSSLAPGGVHTSPSSRAFSDSSPPRHPPPRLIARGLYLKLRGQHPDPSATIHHVLQVLQYNRSDLPPTAPPADRALIHTWAVDDAWERAYEARYINQVLTLPSVALAERLEAAARVRDMFYRRLLHLGDVLGTPEATRSDQDMYTATYKMYRDAGQDLDHLETELHRLTAERMDDKGQDPRWKKREAHITRALIEEYGGNGTVYEILCKRLAEVTTRLEQLREAHASVDTGDYVKLVQLQTSTVAQLQKYTESTKTEAVSKEAREVGLGIMREAETVIGARYPELYDEFVAKVRESLARRGGGGTPPTRPARPAQPAIQAVAS